MKSRRTHLLQKIVSMIIVLCLFLSIASQSFAITIQEEVIWFFDMLAAQDVSLRTQVVSLIAVKSGEEYQLDTAGALSEPKIEKTIEDILVKYDTMGITPRPSAGTLKTALGKLVLLNEQDQPLVSALLYQATQSGALLMDIQIMMKKLMELIAKQNQTIRTEIVEIIANKTGDTYTLDTTALDDANYKNTVDSIVNKLVAEGITTPGKRVMTELGLYGLQKFNSASPGITGYMLTQLTKKLVDVTTPDGLGSIQTKIEKYTISYKIFINLLLNIDYVNKALEYNAESILVYEEKSGNIVKDPVVDKIFKVLLKNVSDSETEKEKLNEFKTRIEDLLSKTNDSPATEKQVLVNHLKELKLLVVKPANNGGGSTTTPGGGGGDTTPAGGGNPASPAPTPAASSPSNTDTVVIPDNIALTDEGVPYATLSQQQLVAEFTKLTASYGGQITQLTNDANAAARAKTANDIVTTIARSQAIISLLSTREEILARAEEAIQKMSGSVNILSQFKESTDGIRNQLLNLARTAQARAASSTLTMDPKATSPVYTLTGTALNNILDMFKTSRTDTEQLNSALSKLVVPATLPNNVQLTLNSQSTTNAGMTMPTSLLAAATDSKVDSMTVQLGVAQFTFKPETLNNTKNDSVTLQAQKLDKQSITPALPQETLNAIGSSPVYSFKALAGETPVSFKGKVTVTVPVTSSDTGSMTAYYMDSTGKLQNIGGYYDADLNAYVFSVEHFSNYIIKTNKVTFSDVTSTYWASGYIASAAAKEIITGTGGGKFQPDGKVTKAQFVSMLIRAIKPDGNSLGSAKMSYTDVVQNKWYYNDIDTAYKAGLLADNGASFQPDKVITRQEAAVILGRALVKYKMMAVPKNTGNIMSRFTDSGSIDRNSTGYVALVVSEGLITGTAADKFSPDGSTTRAQAAAIIIRYLEAD